MKTLTPAEQDTLLATLRTRFIQYADRHPNISWDEVEAKLRQSPLKLVSLSMMEGTGGEPDVVEADSAYAFYDCSPESPV